MSRYRTQGVLAVGLGILTCVACSSPDLKTDLRPEGDPEVLTVMAHNGVDSSEVAMYCHYDASGVRDVKAPGFVGDPVTGGGIVCPEKQSDFTAADMDPRAATTDDPDLIFNVDWGVRIMFDELLNPDVETLDCNEDNICSGSLESTLPLRLTCGATNTVVHYTGYYVPNGNRDTFPLGPSLFIKPVISELTFPTGTPCKVAINDNVVDKDGNKVPTDQKSFDFKIADLALVDTFPHDSATPATVDGYSGFIGLAFNAAIDDTSFDLADVQVLDGTGTALDPGDYDFVVDDFNMDAIVAATGAANGPVDYGDGIFVFPTNYFIPDNYTFKWKTGAHLAEVNGGTLTTTEDTSVRFKVPYRNFGTSPKNGATNVAATATIQLFFNGDLVAASVAASELTLKTSAGVDVPFTFTVNGDTLIVDPTGNLASGSYRFSIPAGSAFDGPHSSTVTFTTAKNIAFTVP